VNFGGGEIFVPSSYTPEGLSSTPPYLTPDAAFQRYAGHAIPADMKMSFGQFTAKLHATAADPNGSFRYDKRQVYAFTVDSACPIITDLAKDVTQPVNCTWWALVDARTGALLEEIPQEN
jgi:hypothetical protein